MKVRDGAQITKTNIYKDQWGDKILQQVVKNSPHGLKDGITTVRVSAFNDIKNKIEVTKPCGWFGDVTREYYVAKPIGIINSMPSHQVASNSSSYHAILSDFIKSNGHTEISLSDINKLNRFV